MANQSDVTKYNGKPCAWCGREYYDKAHVPTKFLIPKDERASKIRWPVMPSCKDCNGGLKLDEEWFATHFASALYGFSDAAKKMFDGPISAHLRKNRSIAERYSKYLKLKELRINGVSQGIKTEINLGNRDWRRLKKVAEMFARGLHYWHSNGKTAKKLKAEVIYVGIGDIKKIAPSLQGLKVVRLFPISFEYAFAVGQQTSVFCFMIYGKLSFLVFLMTPGKYEEARKKIKNITTYSRNKPRIEILG
jgi:hypothetical protein